MTNPRRPGGQRFIIIGFNRRTGSEHGLIVTAAGTAQARAEGVLGILVVLGFAPVVATIPLAAPPRCNELQCCSHFASSLILQVGGVGARVHQEDADHQVDTLGLNDHEVALDDPVVPALQRVTDLVDLLDDGGLGAAVGVADGILGAHGAILLVELNLTCEPFSQPVGLLTDGCGIHICLLSVDPVTIPYAKEFVN